MWSTGVCRSRAPRVVPLGGGQMPQRGRMQRRQLRKTACNALVLVNFADGS